ncbi:MAG: 4Fe-4S dicluster domain-containing protein [Candidatus Lokiarchaeota archaeon]|nr:4Fe-4S dicluster domain-containing protein [Candidatus Lokiarchaeota archaeon]MBD3337924.1 4Fe-4S dicluster domain-containing protein [Candidatus Lokiarchaeota archaeon]
MEKVGAVLVVGAGIGGSQASLDLADSGYKVYLVESTTSIGGVMAQLDKTFPTNDCAMCIVSPKLVETGRHNNIELIINAKILDFVGEPGNFTVNILKKSLYVNPDKCTGCGVCGQKCPVEAIDVFNEGLSKNKATSVKYPQAVPLVYAINKDYCIGCGVCEGVCKAGAVEYDRKDEEVQLNIGAVILAPGFDEFDPSKIKRYGYGEFKNVVTSIEFERILSASGPYSGKILRPSDGQVPVKIAFLQCVGSRDLKEGKPYCSSVCCMYTAKEAVIAKEHMHQVQPTIFSMDIRAYGKDFDKYINNAQEEYGIRYIRSRISSILETPQNNDLKLVYEAENGDIIEEIFNMVVLSVGLNPPHDANYLAEKFGIALNEFNFIKTNIFNPVQTSRKGILACGAATSPKDIPETVTQASAAAGCVNQLLYNQVGTLITEKTLPSEIFVAGQPPRIGVFICHCGINIGGYVDVPEVTRYAKTLPNVVLADRNLYTCSADTQTIIKEKIKEYKLNRVIVASCTPRTHEPLFQETIREAGLNRYLFQMANIRDQCSWVHMNVPEEATQKAKDLVRMAVKKARKIEPLERIKLNVTRKALVIGGGIAGMIAALNFGSQNYETFLIEKEKELGGHARNIFKTLEGGDVQEFLEELKYNVRNNDNIHVFTQAAIQNINGYIGNFRTSLQYGENDEIVDLEHGIILVATGAKEYKPTEYLAGKDVRVLTQSEFEYVLNKTNEIKEKKKIVMIQCVGSRNKEHPYCSKICCAEAIKNALLAKERNPDNEIVILYRDIRTYGFKETYYKKARELGVVFLRYDEVNPPVVSSGGNKLHIEFESPKLGTIHLESDLLVLSVGIVADTLENEELAKKLKVPLNDDNFFLEAHVKLRPVDFATEGVFVAGLAHCPKTIEDSIAQANAAVSRACTILTKDEIEAEGKIAVVDPARCSGCGMCVENCSYNAIELVEDRRFGSIAMINQALCKGCGACSGNCRCSAIDVMGFTNEQIFEMITGRL